jgi:hypothetical protein
MHATRYPWRPALWTTLAVLAALFLRRPEVFLHPQFWAEDGPVFFMYAENVGMPALFLPYGGYHHFVLRLIAAACSGLDPLWIPAAYFWASNVILGGVVAAIFSPRIHLRHRTFTALAIVGVAHTGEAFSSLTNSQWILALGLVLLLLARDADKPGGRLVDCFAALVLGLTGVFSIVLTPFFILRALFRRSAASIAVALVVTAAAAVQVYALAHGPPGGTAPANTVGEFLAIIGLRVFAGLLLPATWAVLLGTGAQIALALIATSALVWFALQKSPERPTRLVLLGALAAVTAATMYKFNGYLGALGGMENGDRYFFIPKVLLLWLLIQSWEGAHHRIARLAGFAALLASLAGFRFIPYLDLNWPQWAARIRAGESVTVPTNPEGTSFRYEPRGK